MIYIASIPHTGTRFVRDVLLAGLETHAEHLWPEAMVSWRERWAVQVWPTVVPLRHPTAVAQSWKRRGKNVLELGAWWSRLVNEVDPYLPFMLPLDGPGREAELGRLNRYTGLELATDWRVLPADDYPPGPPPPLNTRELDSVRGTWYGLEPFFRRFYPREAAPP